MNPALPTWIIERKVARGALRIGVAGHRFAAELNGRRLALANNDILSLREVAAHLAGPLRSGGYTHLLGGQVGLLPGEAHTLTEVARGTPEGLEIHRGKLLEALDAEGDAVDTTQEALSGLANHGDERGVHVSAARQALMDFDRAHPQVRAAARARQNGETA